MRKLQSRAVNSESRAYCSLPLDRCAGKCLISSSLKKKKSRLATFANFCGVTTLTMVDVVSLNMDLGRGPHNSSWEPELATLGNSSTPQPPALHHKARRWLLCKVPVG